MDQPVFVPVPERDPIKFMAVPKQEVREWYEDARPAAKLFVVGVDLGQARDFSTIVIDEVGIATRTHYQQTAYQAVGDAVRTEAVKHHRLRHVERIPLGMAYPDVIARVGEVMGRLPPLPRPPILVADATGCGRPVIDMMRRSGLVPMAVTITAGSGQTVERDNARVAKRILASGVAVALDYGRLQVVAVGSDVAALRSELAAFRVKTTAAGSDSFESWREADHDDLVLAAALCVWAGERWQVPRQINPLWSLYGGI